MGGGVKSETLKSGGYSTPHFGGPKAQSPLQYEARRELTFFEGTLVIQICYRIVVLSLWNTSPRKKKSPDPLPPNSRISNPFGFPCSNSIDSLSREQKSHFWICENYGAIWD